MIKKRYDLVVVGAGPAGSSAAKRAAEAGFDVLLIEKRQEIGDPVRCAEGAGKRGIKRHIKPDPRWIAAEVRGSRVFAPDGTRLEISEEGSGVEVGYVLERKIFDRVLAEEAADAGADVMVKTLATGLIREDGRVAGIQGRSLGRAVEVRAGLVVGADGVESMVGRWAGIETTLAPGDIETCAQFLLKGVEVDDYCEFYLSNRLAPGGYVWVFPKGDGMANVGIGVLGSRSESGMPIELLTRFVNKNFPSARVVEVVVGGVPVCGPIKRTIADGLMLVGDAARQSDPVTGGGILNALDAGVIAGEVAAGSLEKGDVSREALKEYEERWREKIGASLARSLVVKERLVQLSDKDLNTLAHSIKDKDIARMGLFDLLSLLFKTNPRLLWSLRKLF